MAITPILTKVLACVCAQLAAEGRPAVECCQTAGDTSMASCDCVSGGANGRAWARFTGATFSDRAPSRCPLGLWVANFQVGVSRCIADNEAVSDCELSTADAGIVAADAGSLTKAIQCCGFDSRHWVLGSVNPIGPAGGCVGVVVSFSVQVETLG